MTKTTSARSLTLEAREAAQRRTYLRPREHDALELHRVDVRVAGAREDVDGARDRLVEKEIHRRERDRSIPRGAAEVDDLFDGVQRESRVEQRLARVVLAESEADRFENVEAFVGRFV